MWVVMSKPENAVIPIFRGTALRDSTKPDFFSPGSAWLLTDEQ